MNSVKKRLAECKNIKLQASNQMEKQYQDDLSRKEKIEHLQTLRLQQQQQQEQEHLKSQERRQLEEEKIQQQRTLILSKMKQVQEKLKASEIELQQEEGQDSNNKRKQQGAFEDNQSDKINLLKIKRDPKEKSNKSKKEKHLIEENNIISNKPYKSSGVIVDSDDEIKEADQNNKNEITEIPLLNNSIINGQDEGIKTIKKDDEFFNSLFDEE